MVCNAMGDSAAVAEPGKAPQGGGNDSGSDTVAALEMKQAKAKLFARIQAKKTA
jgi:hypothetical protein